MSSNNFKRWQAGCSLRSAVAERYPAVKVKNCRSFSGFRREVARLVNYLGLASMRRCVRLLQCTGYEEGSFLNEVFNAWSEYNCDPASSAYDRMCSSWPIVHDALVNATDGAFPEDYEKVLELEYSFE